MRSDKEMFELILGTAKENEFVRAVIMNGSRANQSIKRDIFQDFDICYIVTTIEPFQDDAWIERFGEFMILQKPNLMGEDSEQIFDFLTYLMQFTDGTRIDLKVIPIDKFHDDGEPTVVLLDKDQILPDFDTPTGEIYHIKPPTKKQFEDCCNEYWWINPYVAKGLWREELPYVKEHIELCLRKELLIMLDWYVGINHNFQVSTGKMSKYLNKFLSQQEWEEYLSTYSDGNVNNIWDSVFAMNELFRKVALIVSKHFDYPYPSQEDERVTAYMKHIKALPKDAKSIY